MDKFLLTEAPGHAGGKEAHKSPPSALLSLLRDCSSHETARKVHKKHRNLREKGSQHGCPSMAAAAPASRGNRAEGDGQAASQQRTRITVTAFAYQEFQAAREKIWTPPACKVTPQIFPLLLVIYFAYHAIRTHCRLKKAAFAYHIIPDRDQLPHLDTHTHTPAKSSSSAPASSCVLILLFLSPQG